MEPEQLARLIERHADALVLFARQWCDAPEDVVQEAFVALTGQGTTPENPAAWLFRAVRNGAINAGTASRRRRRHEEIAASSAPSWFDRPDDPTGVAGSVAHAIDPDDAGRELRSLPVDQREVIVAHLWGGLTFGQIAELTGRSSSAAHRLYQSGLETLRTRLGAPCRSRTHRSGPTGT
ncbi:RNA polymerase sigma factor [Tautonia plasticadhaerens]|uniref:RNA polymerase sigma factor RpoE n=1 Tax=Tautonia plasticadhaerens TaxID=2527974 RepID=A0A518HC09_9BACT|nr:sigma-70 family RNA polymerase sigma factor [Tautonia plasticadhaerens]QDV38403.1 RNA polymerase sigma factor RpoE [Tautonia plasticadhaerens]